MSIYNDLIKCKLSTLSNTFFEPRKETTWTTDADFCAQARICKTYSIEGDVLYVRYFIICLSKYETQTSYIALLMCFTKYD